jgi:hypothetical protein
MFGVGSPYRVLLFGFLIGALSPFPAYLLAKRFRWPFLQYVNVPVMLSAMVLIPPASGINYSSWAAVGFVFRKSLYLQKLCKLTFGLEFLLRRYRFRWWAKYNFVTSAALDTGTVIGVVLLFLTLQLPKGGKLSIDWWGNNVFLKTLDATGVTYRAP